MRKGRKHYARRTGWLLISFLLAVVPAYAGQPLSNNKDVTAYLKAMNLKHLDRFVVQFTGTPELYSKYGTVDINKPDLRNGDLAGLFPAPLNGWTAGPISARRSPAQFGGKEKRYQISKSYRRRGTKTRLDISLDTSVCTTAFVLMKMKPADADSISAPFTYQGHKGAIYYDHTGKPEGVHLRVGPCGVLIVWEPVPRPKTKLSPEQQRIRDLIEGK